MPEGPPSPVDVIRLEPMGRFKQTQNGNVRVQGGFLIFRFFLKKNSLDLHNRLTNSANFLIIYYTS